MAIIKIPNAESLPESVSCEICSKVITPKMATVGMRAIDGKQTFACNGHFWDGGKLIRGWADFIFSQWRSRDKDIQASYSSDVGLCMNDLYVELRETASAMSWDIAHHLFARHLNGTVAVVTDNPVAILSAVKKQWARLERQVQRERASTLDATRIWALSKALSHMQNLYFTVESSENNGRTIIFSSKDHFLKIPPTCHTLYITLQVSGDEQIKLTSSMPRYALVVNYLP